MMGAALIAAALSGGTPPVVIGTPVAQGIAGIGTTATSITTTTLANMAVGDLFVLAVMRASSGVLTASDALGNTYTVQTELTDTESTNRLFFVRCKVTTPIPAGSTITLNNTVSTRWAVSSCSVSGTAASPFDQQTVGNAGNDTAPTTVATAALAQANSIAFGAFGVNSGFNDTFTQPSGFTALPKGGVSGENGVHWGYTITAATTALTYGPAALSTGRIWLGGVTVYKGA